MNSKELAEIMFKWAQSPAVKNWEHKAIKGYINLYACKVPKKKADKYHKVNIVVKTEKAFKGLHITNEDKRLMLVEALLQDNIETAVQSIELIHQRVNGESFDDIQAEFDF